MSSGAESFYRQQAASAGIGSIPAILDGQCVPLLNEGEMLSVRATTSDVFDRLQGQLELVREHVARIAMPHHPYVYHDGMRATLNGFAKRAIMQQLRPRQLATGKFHSVQLEAVAPTELATPTLGHIKLAEYFKAFSSSQPRQAAACFAITGILQSGREVHRPAALAVIRTRRSAKTPESDKLDLVYSVQKLTKPTIPDTLLSTFQAVHFDNKSYTGSTKGGMFAKSGGTTPRRRKS